MSGLGEIIEQAEETVSDFQLGAETVTVAGPPPQLDPRLSRLLTPTDPPPPLNQDPEELHFSYEMVLTDGANLERRGRRLQIKALLNSPQVAAGYVMHRTHAQGTSEIAAMLGVTTQELEAWREGAPLEVDRGRLCLVARVLLVLDSMLSDQAIGHEFSRPLRSLDSRSINELLDSGEDDVSEVLLHHLWRSTHQLGL